MSEPIIDAWIQHPFRRFLSEPMFESILRWMGKNSDEIPEVPPEMTLAALDSGGVNVALVSAWWGPVPWDCIGRSLSSDGGDSRASPIRA